MTVYGFRWFVLSEAVLVLSEAVLVLSETVLEPSEYEHEHENRNKFDPWKAVTGPELNPRTVTFFRTASHTPT